ncbi:TIGR04222 domain-containing membrane protein [Nonomuraea fuscirosea]|uniref:TIGR04222 domain-containing membrane protein n=1 Tax=Nonomuraea fuscirosea TaxID=1291556 RepID=UPI002DDBECA0|nr:TIGR04222 domain-containing membrane protein [Nonomuraea fuscirosea]WSA48366.1 TIGR04222 domain-containing membrane protein [Nonomuraea fuscirosea]
MDPFDILFGADLVIAACVCALVLVKAGHAVWLRWWPHSDDLELDAYELAYIEGGAGQMINTAVAGLLRAGVLLRDQPTATCTRAGGVMPGDRPIERMIADYAETRPDGFGVCDLDRLPGLRAQTRAVRRSLTRRGMLPVRWVLTLLEWGSGLFWPALMVLWFCVVIALAGWSDAELHHPYAWPGAALAAASMVLSGPLPRQDGRRPTPVAGRALSSARSRWSTDDDQLEAYVLYGRFAPAWQTVAESLYPPVSFPRTPARVADDGSGEE